jgi:secretion/DNA translocation related TadE-like protein
MSFERRDEGSSTVLVLGFVTVLLLVGGLVASAASLVVTRHRAEAAADLAALAAAGRAFEGQLAACAAARHVAVAQGVRLLGCRLDGLDAVVEVGVRAPGRLGELGLVHGRAKAGRRGLGTRDMAFASYPEKAGRVARSA